MNQVIRFNSSPQLPTLVAAAGERASMRFLEFFAAARLKKLRDGEPCLDAHHAALDRRRDELSLDEVERIVI